MIPTCLGSEAAGLPVHRMRVLHVIWNIQRGSVRPFHCGAFQIGHRCLGRLTIMAGSTLASRALGQRLSEFRTRKKLSANAIARAVEISPQTYGRLEKGFKSSVTDLLTNALANVLELSDDERAELLQLAADTRAASKRDGNWWRDWNDGALTDDFNHYLSLEQTSESIATWDPTLVPGILQTSGYRRILTQSTYPNTTESEMTRVLTLLTKRQERLEDPRFHVEGLLSELALRRVVGGDRAVMAAQLERLADLGQRPNIDIRVVPLTAPPVGDLAGPFVLLTPPYQPVIKMRLPQVVHVDFFAGSLFMERPADVARYSDALKAMHKVALPPEPSEQLIRAAAKEYKQ